MIEDKIEFKLKNRLSELDTLYRNLERLGDREEAVYLGKMAISAAKGAADEKALVRARALLGEIEAAKDSE